MKITCQSCQSKYNVADEKVQGKIVKIRCRKCGATIVVHGTGGTAAAANGSAPAPEPAPVPEPAAAPPPAANEWHVNLGDDDQRTMTLAELVDAYNSSVVTQDTFIWTDGMDDWKPLAEVDVVVNALHENAASAAAAEAAHAPAHAAPAPAPAAAEEPPTRSLDIGGGGFGSAFSDRAPAAAIAAPAPEAKRAAVRREGARGRDLFGGGGLGAEEVQTSAPAMPQAMDVPSDGQGGLTGQRNENSVLFSLAVLTKNADERAPSQPPAGRSSEDSGLIDLKALAAKAESNRPPAPADGGVFSAPIGISAPLGAPLGALASPFGAPEPEAKSKLPLYIGGAAGMVLLLVVGVVIGAQIAGKEAPAPAPIASVAPVVTAPEPSATASAPAAEASAAASASAAPKAKFVYHGPIAHPQAGGAAPPAGGAATASSGGPSAPTPPPTKVKPGNDCGCNGDLMCLMKCSTH